MRVVYFICAESSSLDVQSGRVSIFHILDEVSATALPIFMASAATVVLFEREPDDPQVLEALLSVALNGNELAKLPINIDFQDKPRHRSLGTIQGMMIPNAGTVSFSVRYLEKELALFDFRVTYVGTASFQGVNAANNPSTAVTPDAPARQTSP